MRECICSSVFIVVVALAARIAADFSLENGGNLNEDPEMHMSTPQIVRHWGYPAEEHFPITDDGYILGLHRIPRGKDSLDGGNRGPVLLVHGLLSSSSCWVTNLPSQSLGFILADAGYDVWLANVRGNTYSKNHTTLSLESPDFWAFSWQDMAKYDLPAIVDYILEQTDREKLHYVGHSQGSLVMFTKGSEDVDGSFSSKIETFIALGPVTRVDHMTSVLGYLGTVAGPLKWFFKLLGTKEFLANSWIIDKWTEMTCGSRLKFICSNFLFLVADFNPNNLNATRVPVYFTHTPAGTSVQNILHFAQEISSKAWQHYDFGRTKNMLVYKQTTPPRFDATKVRLPVYAFWAGKDTLAEATDVEWLLARLPNIVESWYDPEMDHLGYVWGLNAKERVYNHMLRILEEHALQ